MVVTNRKDTKRDPEKRAAKRKRQRAAGFSGKAAKRSGSPAALDHNKGRMSAEGRTGEASRVARRRTSDPAHLEVVRRLVATGEPLFTHPERALPQSGSMGTYRNQEEHP